MITGVLEELEFILPGGIHSNKLKELVANPFIPKNFRW